MTQARPIHDADPGVGIEKASSLLSGALARPVAGFAPLHFRHELIGAVSPQWIDLLEPSLFDVTPREDDPLPRVRLKGGDRRSEGGLIPIERINASLQAWAIDLKQRGLLPGWRGERTLLFGASEGDPLFGIERSLLRPLGLLLRTVQVNVFTVQKKQLRIWVALRAPGKPVDPGLLDTLVGGGIIEDASPLETLTREAQEEAGIARSLARRAVPVGVIDSTAAEQDGASTVLHRERAMLYDLQVPPEYAPRLLDGEVSEASLEAASAVLGSITAGHWTREGAWASHDLIRRHAAVH